jgi:hypothetical protein
MTVIIDGNNTPTAGGVGYGDGTELAFTTAGTSGQVLQSNGASAPSWVAAGGGFSNFTVLTSGTSYTVPSGVTKIKVTATGGGGSGGATSGSTAGGGGGSGATAIKIFTVVAGSSYTYAIGAGGAPTGSGGNTTFTVGATTITGGGGSSGGGGGNFGGGAGGTATSGDINIGGGGGGVGSRCWRFFIVGRWRPRICYFCWYCYWR